jgi:hypothetical protein
MSGIFWAKAGAPSKPAAIAHDVIALFVIIFTFNLYTDCGPRCPRRATGSAAGAGGGPGVRPLL